MVRQAAQERLDAIRMERGKRDWEYTSAIAVVKGGVLASDEASAEAERGVKLERQKQSGASSLRGRRPERQNTC